MRHWTPLRCTEVSRQPIIGGTEIMDARLHTGEPHKATLDALRAAVAGVPLVVVGGAPGTGKTELGGLLAQMRGTLLVSSDAVCCPGGNWLPWDEQPHAATRAVLADGTWGYRSTAEGVAAARAVFRGLLVPDIFVWCDRAWVDKPGSLAASMLGRYRRWATEQLAHGGPYRRTAPELLDVGLQLWTREGAQ